MRRARFTATSPNVAARVQAMAEPGAVLVTARVQRQVAGLFVAEERGTHTTQGRARADRLFSGWCARAAADAAPDSAILHRWSAATMRWRC